VRVVVEGQRRDVVCAKEGTRMARHGGRAD
jgi:hypothetical protein